MRSRFNLSSAAEQGKRTVMIWHFYVKKAKKNIRNEKGEVKKQSADGDSGYVALSVRFF